MLLTTIATLTSIVRSTQGPEAGRRRRPTDARRRAIDARHGRD
jgi:hypothetical protein